MKSSWGEANGLKFLQVDPDDDGGQLPLIVAVHGRGADAADLGGLAPELSRTGYRWVLPQGPLPVPFAPNWVGWAWYELGETQDQTVVASRDRLAGLIDETIERLDIPRDRVMLMGFSQGAVMALHVGLFSPEPFAAVVAMSGHLPAADTLIPVLPERTDRRVLVVHGTQDETLPIERGRRIRDVLRTAGLHPEYHEFQMGHQITAQSLAVVREFVARVLPPGEAVRPNPSS